MGALLNLSNYIYLMLGSWMKWVKYSVDGGVGVKEWW